MKLHIQQVEKPKDRKLKMCCTFPHAWMYGPHSRTTFQTDKLYHDISYGYILCSKLTAIYNIIPSFALVRGPDEWIWRIIQRMNTCSIYACKDTMQSSFTVPES
jgi:hypothetical protein